MTEIKQETVICRGHVVKVEFSSNDKNNKSRDPGRCDTRYTVGSYSCNVIVSVDFHNVFAHQNRSFDVRIPVKSRQLRI